MSAHTQHYTPPPARRGGKFPIILVLGSPVAAIVIAGVLHFTAVSTGPQVRAIPAGTAHPVALGAIDQQAIADLRTEGFRAGLAEGLQQGCGNVSALSAPIRTAQP